MYCLTRLILRLAPLVFSFPALADQPGAYVFGDSAAEQGNLYTLPGAEVPPDVYYNPDGFFRDSNGPIWTETMFPGIRPVEGCADIALCGTRLNFAFSGATTGTTSVAAGGDGTGLAAQVDRFEALVAAGLVTPRKTDIAFVDAGPNTIFEAFPSATGPGDILAAGTRGGQELAQAATRLARTGVGYVLVNDFADAGLAPAFGDNPDGIALASLASQAGSDALHEAVRSANADRSGGPVIAIVQSRKLVGAMVASPESFGFANATDACYDDNTGTICAPDRPSQNRYVFFDNAGHPTESAQLLLARYYRATADSFTGVRQAEFAGIATRTITLGETFGLLLRDQARRAGPMGLHPYVFGMAGQHDAANGAHLVDQSGPSANIGLGLEQRSDILIFGAALSIGRGQVESGKLDGTTKDLLAGLYGRWQSGSVFVSGDLFAGTGKIDDLIRDIGVPTFLSRSAVDYGLTGAELEAGWKGHRGAWSYSLSGLVRATRFRSDPFRETGAEGLNLTVSHLSANRVEAGIGGRIERSIPVSSGILTAGLEMQALRGISGRTRVTTSLDGSEARPISFNYAAETDGTLLLAPEIGYETTGGLRISLRYQTRTGADATSDQLMVSLRQSF